MKYLILLFVLTGCPSTGFDPGIEFETNHPKAFQTEIQEIVEDRFGHPVETNVFWTITPCPTSDEAPTAVVYRDKCYHGFTFDCEHIYVADRGPVAKSAFIHELGHCVRLDMGLDGDAKHEDTDWWDTIEEIKQEVRENERYQ